MHLRYLPDSMVSLFGRRYVQSFYRYVVRSPRELLVVHKDRDRVTAACVLSLAPNTLSRRLVFETPFVLWAPVAAFRDIVRRIGGTGRQPGPAALEAASGSHPGSDLVPYHNPEVIYIFVDSSSRNRGLGSDMLASCERYLQMHGFDRYIINTWGDGANPTTRFYLRNGFTMRRRFISRGIHMQTMEKNLGAQPDTRER